MGQNLLDIQYWGKANARLLCVIGGLYVTLNLSVSLKNFAIHTLRNIGTSYIQT